MKTLRKLFFETKMTWVRVILFAVATAVVTAAVLLLPVTADTSFENLGVSFECWILFALIVSLNCETPLEAGLKTFVFFLVSQPLIYLLQVPFSSLGWGLFQYYPRWFVWTVLCLPGGMIAWLVKKDRWWSALILSVATGFLGAVGVYFLQNTLRQFPKNLISVLFCFLLAAGLIFVLLKKRGNRMLAGAITLAVTAAACVLLLRNAPAKTVTGTYALPEGPDWEIGESEGYVGSVFVDENGVVSVEALQYGTEELTVENEAGDRVTLVVTYDKANGLQITEK